MLLKKDFHILCAILWKQSTDTKYSSSINDLLHIFTSVQRGKIYIFVL
jgi:hypothetical protein